MNHLKAPILIACMLFILQCNTTHAMQLQENFALIVATKSGNAYTENIDESSGKPLADFIESNPPYYIYKKQSVDLVQEVPYRDISVREPVESVYSHTVNYKTIEEEMEEIRDISKKEIISDSKQSLDNKITAVSDEYYVQVGSWKNLKYAEEKLTILKKQYPDVNIIEQNNFYKVRISGELSNKRAAMISKKIKRKFNMKSLVVLKEKNTSPAKLQTASNTKIQSTSLADAVRPFIGTSYTKMNCYGLIVTGLINQGIQYHGHGGLRKKLENLALLDDLPINAYLNGEGLVEKVGEKIFSNSIYKISNIQEATDNIYSEITPYLREGHILSFSTTTRGHTGIVSRQEDIWTYINSGVIDNQVSPSRLSKGVGEEFLKAEINNWVVLASSRKEPLTVTLGQIDKNQLQDFAWLKKSNKLTALNIY